MTLLHTTTVAAPASEQLRRVAAWVFAATLFVSAVLLFSVQPMFTKMVLPKLGGAPSVWSVAMVAFQGFLFVGYLYAHALSRALAPARAGLVHLAFLAAVALTLPLGIAPSFGNPPTDGVMFWLVGLFTASIGLPFIALAASAPLLQSWFAGTSHPLARNPYVLYAASNLGSFAALLLYPFAVEPFFTLHEQRMIWSAGFCLLALLVGLAAIVAARLGAVTPVRPAIGGVKPTTMQRAQWMLLTAIPAGLCIAMTSYITTDIAAAPFIWVVPLALYLLTFVAVFRERAWLPHASVLRYLPYLVAPLAVSILGGSKVHWLVTIILNLAVFVGIALACHGEAYRRRPDNGHLTEFYLWTSFGGVLGGIFAGLLSPHIFSNIYEYPLLIVAALAVLPGAFAGGWRVSLKQLSIPLALIVLAIASRAFFDVRLPMSAQEPLQFVLIAIAAAALLQTKKPARFIAIIVLGFVVSGVWRAGGVPIETARSFFGVHQVVDTADRSHRLIYHGVTIHGAEKLRNADGAPVTGRPVQTSYYYPGGPYSDAIDATRAAQGGLKEVAIVGLGAGNLVCHSKPGEQWTFFEIDPEVIRIARDSGHFRFLSDCAPNTKIVTGDARLTLTTAPSRYDFIALDAFSSDAIPVHLLTREAFTGYLSRLNANGVLVAHVSNQHMELATVVAAIARDLGLVAFTKQDNAANSFFTDFRANAELVVMARSEADLGDLPSRPGWKRADPRGVTPWTDDYSDLLRAIVRKKTGT